MDISHSIIKHEMVGFMKKYISLFITIVTVLLAIPLEAFRSSAATTDRAQASSSIGAVRYMSSL